VNRSNSIPDRFLLLLKIATQDVEGKRGMALPLFLVPP
jgi:hypothetical protein